ncbi:MAG: PIN domain-containing protein [Anaerolineae bacterium]|nr:PIN domain-containing protein [Anaerolineae bacterium]
MPDVLVDASFLVALGYPGDVNHQAAKGFAARRGLTLLIPDVVLPEAMYNLRRLGGTPAALRFADVLIKQEPTFIPLMTSDFERAIALMRAYMKADLDLVDCCITAIAERLNITQICTFDHRDFRIIRPRHVDYFEVLP